MACIRSVLITRQNWRFVFRPSQCLQLTLMYIRGASITFRLGKCQCSFTRKTINVFKPDDQITVSFKDLWITAISYVIWLLDLHILSSKSINSDYWIITWGSCLFWNDSYKIRLHFQRGQTTLNSMDIPIIVIYNSIWAMTDDRRFSV